MIMKYMILEQVNIFKINENKHWIEPSYPSNITSYDYYVNYSEIPDPTGSAPLDANTIGEQINPKLN